MRSRWLAAIDAVPSSLMIVLYLLCLAALMRECNARQHLGRSLQSLSYRTQVLEDRVAREPRVGPWRVHTAARDTTYACRHPGWERDSLWPARLKEIDPGISAIFEPLPVGSSFSVVAVGARQLAAYYEDEVGHGKGFEREFRGQAQYSFDPRKFREFWERSGREFEDIGEFIRESIDEWLRHKKSATREEKGPSEGSKQT